MFRWSKIAAALAAPLLLVSCVFTPGKFTSSLAIHADRSFTFTYVGEVNAIDLESMMGKAMMEGMKAGAEEPAKKKKGKTAEEDEPPFDLAMTPEEKAEQDRRFTKIAAELAKEAGYKTIEYRGNGVFYVDFAISGTLQHSFVYPYNPDNNVMFPWLAIELRGKDMVRVKAPGFAKQDLGGMGMPMGGPMGQGMAALGGANPSPMEGTFTLTTDAEIVSQNNEEGALTDGTNRVIAWKVDADTADAPMASLRVTPLP